MKKPSPPYQQLQFFPCEQPQGSFWHHFHLYTTQWESMEVRAIRGEARGAAGPQKERTKPRRMASQEEVNSCRRALMAAATYSSRRANVTGVARPSGINSISDPGSLPSMTKYIGGSLSQAACEDTSFKCCSLLAALVSNCDRSCSTGVSPSSSFHTWPHAEGTKHKEGHHGVHRKQWRGGGRQFEPAVPDSRGSAHNGREFKGQVVLMPHSKAHQLSNKLKHRIHGG